MSIKNIFRLLFGFFCAIFFIWLIFRRISIEQVGQAFIDIRWHWLIASLLVFCLGYIFRIQRWRTMLLRNNPVLIWSRCAGPLLGSFALNNILPFRAGDFVRVFAFNKVLGVTSSAIVATLFVERLLDLLMVLVFLLLALRLFGGQSSGLLGIGELGLFLLALAILICLLFPKIFFPLARFFSDMLTRISPGIGSKIRLSMDDSLSVLMHLSGNRMMVSLLLWSFLAWFSEGCVFWFAALGLPSIFTAIGAWLALPVGTLATLIPSTPGYVGTFDYFVIEAMKVAGNSLEGATAFALVVHIIIWAPPTIIGGLYLLLNSVLDKNLLKKKNEYLN